jgi:hypothetical protein
MILSRAKEQTNIIEEMIKEEEIRKKKLCENFCSKIQLNLYTLNYAL